MKASSLLKFSAVLLLSWVLVVSVFAQATSKKMRGLTSLEMAAEMAPGVNLWNTLDAVCWWCEGCKNGLESERAWGNPYTTPQMIQAMADRGFKSIRIPVTWFNHMGTAPDYKIDKIWMDRVEAVVNYALDANLYVTINIHHDDYHIDHKGSWLIPTYEKQEEVTDQLIKVWTQIAERFKDYGDHLLFETMNEPRVTGGPDEWNGGTQEHREVINAFNVAIVNTIRATGGNNKERFILVPQVGANMDATLENMVVPDDSNIIVTVHAYHPFNFTISDPKDEQSTDRWGTPLEVAEIENMHNKLNQKFISKGIGVVLGEWGVDNRDNYDQRVNYYETLTNICKKNGVTPVPWVYDFNRETLTWENPLLADAIIQAYDSKFVKAEKLTLDTVSVKLKVGEKLQLSASIFPENTTTKDVAWGSDNKKVAIVTAKGMVKALAKGKAKITAITIGKSTVCEIIVVK
jgi:endoglucanase